MKAEALQAGLLIGFFCICLVVAIVITIKNEIMIRIRQAKIDLYTDQQLDLYEDNMKNHHHINVIGRALSSQPTHKYF